MPVGHVATGILEGMANYLTQERERRRKAEDSDIDYRMKVIESLINRPDANPAHLGQALQDLYDLSAAKSSRKPKGGREGFMGSSELPISQVLMGVQSGATPLIGNTTETMQAPGFESAADEPLNPAQLPGAMGNPQFSPDKEAQMMGFTGQQVLESPVMVPPAPIQTPPTGSRMLGAARGMQREQPVAKQPLLRSPEEMARQTGRAAGIKANEEARGKRSGDLEALTELFGRDEALSILKRDMLGTAGMAQDAEGGIYEVPDGTGGTRKVRARLIFDPQTRTTKTIDAVTGMPLPPDAVPSSITTATPTDNTYTLQDAIALWSKQNGREPSYQEMLKIRKDWEAQNNNPPAAGSGGGGVSVSDARLSTMVGNMQNRYENFRKDLSTMEGQATEMESAYAQLRAALPAGMPIAAPHIALIMTFNKIIDPQSVVREGEFDRSIKGQAWFDRIRGIITKVSQGGVGLTMRDIDEYMELARKAVAKRQTQFREQQLPAFFNQSKEFGVNPNNFMRTDDLNWVPTAPAGGGAGGGTASDDAAFRQFLESLRKR